MSQVNEKLVLLVDDSEEDAFLLRAEFRRGGLLNAVKWMSSGAAAINYLKGDGEYAERSRYPLPSIVIFDLQMPQIDGFALLKWIASRPELKRLLIIVLSGLDDLKSVERAYALGANSYLCKPINRYDVANMVSFFKDYWLISSKSPGESDSPRSEGRALEI